MLNFKSLHEKTLEVQGSHLTFNSARVLFVLPLETVTVTLSCTNTCVAFVEHITLFQTLSGH